MNKAQVIAVMGAPDSTSATKGVEYMNYDLYATPDDAFQGFSIPYYVRLVNGVVDAYGRQGDFQNWMRKVAKLLRADFRRKSIEVISLNPQTPIDA